ncbi:fms-related tyrosine kinase 3 ligand isoform X2 [Rhinatrema bivittatum]|nr:fms-related tyrosine kinase 3 ligand isoform X2 [Rhinatrema bivittatum]
MILCHASQDTLSPVGSVTLRFFPVAALLLVSLLDPCHSCHFQNPISTTFSRQIQNLSKNLLLDYPVSTTSNLKPDSWCSEIWQLQLVKEELERMGAVAGEYLNNTLQTVWREIAFLGRCNFTVSADCLMAERINISRFLGLLEQQIKILKSKLTGDSTLDFSNCTRILCVSALNGSVEERPGSDSMTSAGPGWPHKEGMSDGEEAPLNQEDYQANTATDIIATWITTSSIAGSRQRRTLEIDGDKNAWRNLATAGPKGWRVRAWLSTPILLLLTFIILFLATYRFWSSRKNWNSVTLELHSLS